MSATMARQGGRVHLAQSDMRRALNMAKMGKGGCSWAAVEETQQLIRKPQAEDQEETKRGVQSLGHRKVKATIERHPAMVCKSHTAGYLPCQNGTAKNPQTLWMRERTATHPPEPVAPVPGMRSLLRSPSPSGTPPAPSGDTEGNASYEIEGMLSRCVYMHSPLPNTQFFNHNALPRIASAINIVFQLCWILYSLGGNTADIDFEDDSSFLSESDSMGKNWLKGTGVLSIIIIYN